MEARSNAGRLLFSACCLLTIAPFVVAPHPPQVDLPQHAAQIAMLLRLDDPTCAYAEELQRNFSSPYLLAYLVAAPLAKLTTVTTAIRAVMALAVLAVPLTFALFVRAIRGPGHWVFLGFPIAFSYAAGWGFLVYAVAIPLAFLFLAAAVRYAERPTAARAIGMALLLALVFYSHALLAPFCGSVALLLLWARRPSLKSAVCWGLPLLMPAPAALFWLRSLQTSFDGELGNVWSHGIERIPELLSQIVGEVPTPTTLAAGLMVVALPWLAGARPSRRWRDWLPTAMAVAWLLVAPTVLFGTAFVHARFQVFVPALMLLAARVPPAPQRRAFAVGSVLIAVAWQLVVAGRWLSFAVESRPFRELLASIPPGQRAYSLVLAARGKSQTASRAALFRHFSVTKPLEITNIHAVLFLDLTKNSPLSRAEHFHHGLLDRWSSAVAPPVYVHMPLWYQAEAGCLVEPSFARSFQTVVTYRPGAGPRLPMGIEVVPAAFGLGARLASGRWPLVIARGEGRQLAAVLAGLPYAPIDRRDDWWLFAWDQPAEGPDD